MLKECPEQLAKYETPLDVDDDAECLGVFTTADPEHVPNGDGPIEFQVWNDGGITMDDTWYLTAEQLKDVATALRQCGFQV